MRLSSPFLTAEISPTGATLTGLQYRPLENTAPLELMGQWSSGSGMTSGYVMAPAIGVISDSGSFTYRGETFASGKHGFARKSLFTCTKQTADSAAFVFTHDPVMSPGLYPLMHRLEIEYTLQLKSLTIQMSIINTSAYEMPIGAGLHPAFHWPLPGAASRDGHILTVKTVAIKTGTVGAGMPQGTEIYRSIDGKIYSDAKGENPFDKNNVWPLRAKQFAKDAFFFIYPEQADTELIFQAPPHQTSLHFNLQGWNGFGIWSRPGDESAFICVEPASGVALIDRADPTPELNNIRGLRRIPVGERFTAMMQILIL
jgi:galactose mutarotase-like enzyme